MTLRIADSTPSMPVRDPGENAKPYIFAGLLVVTLLLGGLAAWSVNAKIDGAVIAPGTVVVESNRKAVQHLEGGVIGALYVREGDRVERGQLLLRLDDTIERADLAVVAGQLHELLAREARLRAEIDGEAAVAFDPALLALEEDPKVRDILEGQAALFQARKEARDGEQEIFQQRIANFLDQTKGLKRQLAATARQIDLVKQELSGVEKLHKKGHAPLTRVLALKRQVSEIETQQARLATEVARVANLVSEVGLQRIQAEKDFRESVTTELRDVRVRIQNLTERRVAAETRLERIEVAAPQAGRVLALKAHTVGGVIQPGETIMEIVPGDDRLVLQAQVPPKDVDKVRAGQSSKVRLSAFDQQVTPEILGTLESVSADLLEDPRRGESYFVARIRIGEAELAKLGGLELVPGMPAEVFIQTGERLAISYLTKPLLETFAKAFKDG